MLLSIYELETHRTVDTATDVQYGFCLWILCNGKRDIVVKVCLNCKRGG